MTPTDPTVRKNMTSNLKTCVLKIIGSHVGCINRVERKKLLKILARDYGIVVSDRIMRRAIEELRDTDPDGAKICSSLDGGYYMAANVTELERYLNTDLSRAVKILKRVNRQRRVAGLSFIQRPLF